MPHLTKLAWASAVLPGTARHAHTVLELVLEMVDRRVSQMNSPGAHCLLWSLWASGYEVCLGSLLLRWLEKGVDLDDVSTAVAVVLLEAECRRDPRERFWLSLVCPGSRGGLIGQVISKWASAAPDWALEDRGCWDFKKVERNKPELAKYLQHFATLEKWAQPASGNHWEKLGALIQFIELRLSRGTPDVPATALQLLQLLDTFARSREHWLKVAGGAKAEILEATFASRKWDTFEVAVECGTFLGYSACRLAVLMCRTGIAAARVITIEVDPVHACIARHLLDLAGVARVVEVNVGQARDVLPVLVDGLGAWAFGLVFMDYKGSIFHADLQLLEHDCALARGGVVIADNVALPGAPLLLWHLAFSPGWELRALAVVEFLEPNTEDWMAVGTYKGPGPAPPPAPESWHRLSWHTDHMRRRAGGLRPTEGDMFEEDRVAYSKHVRRHFLAAGIEATPWSGPVEGEV